MTKRDLQFGDAFHRNKRTLLVLCSALLLTRIPNIDVTGHSGLIGVSFEQVDIRLIRGLLWTGAAYYALGFWLEWWSAYQSNSGALSIEGAVGLNHAVVEHKDRFIKNVEELSATHKNIKDMYYELGKILENTNRFAENIRSDLSTNKTSNLYLTEKLYIEQLNQISDLKTHSAGYLHDISERLFNLHTKSNGILGEIQTAAKHLGRLSSDAVAARRFQFIAWEGLASVGYFLAATWAWLADYLLRFPRPNL